MISVIIPVHNRINLTKICLNSLSPYKSLLNVIIVNDGSTDNTEEVLKEEFPWVIIIKGDGNLFWTGAVHKGIEFLLSSNKINTTYAILMNNDVILPDYGVIEKLVKASAEFGDQAIVSPITVSKKFKDQIIITGVQVNSWFLNRTRKIFSNQKLSNLKVLDPIEVDFITARFLLHPMHVFQKVGNYNARDLPHYGGDDEFSYRCKKHGVRPLIIPTACVYLEDIFDEPSKLKEKSIFFWLFDKRSNINIFSKFALSIIVCPWFARPSFIAIGVLKSLYLAVFRKLL